MSGTRYNKVTHEVISMDGEHGYATYNLDETGLFFIRHLPGCRHWLLIPSTSGLTAGRAYPDTVQIPQVTPGKFRINTLQILRKMPLSNAVRRHGQKQS